MSVLAGAAAVGTLYYLFNKNQRDQVAQRPFTSMRYSDIKEKNSNKIIKLNHKSFQRALKASSPKIIIWKASWCGHCRELMPVLKEANRYVALKIFVIEVGKAPKKFLEKLGLEGFPTILGFDKYGRVREYNGNRDVASIVKFAQRL